MLKKSRKTQRTQKSACFNTHLFVCLIFFLTFVTCPQTWERTPEHSKDKCEHWDNSPEQAWTRWCFFSRSSKQESRPEIIQPVHSNHLRPHWAEMCKADPWSALFTLGWHFDEPTGWLISFTMAHRGREKLISTVWRDLTQKISIYIQDRAKREVPS